METLKTHIEAKKYLQESGISVIDWAKEHGFKEKAVYNVLRGDIFGKFGESFKISVALGMAEMVEVPSEIRLDEVIGCLVGIGVYQRELYRAVGINPHSGRNILTGVAPANTDKAKALIREAERVLNTKIIVPSERERAAKIKQEGLERREREKRPTTETRPEYMPRLRPTPAYPHIGYYNW